MSTELRIEGHSAELGEILVANYLANPAAFGDQLAAHVSQVASKRLRRLMDNNQDWEELSHECVICVMQRIGEFDPRLGALDHWIGGFALNTWRSYVRSSSRMKRNVVSIEDVPEAQYDFEARVTQRENLGSALDSLDVLDRELLHMRYGLGMSSDEIAGASDMNAPQVRKRISRAVEKLRRHPSIQALVVQPLAS